MKKLMSGLLLLTGWLSFSALAAVNLNTATQSELESVKGVGPSKAKAIIEYREAKGGFKTIDELDNVKGFGRASIEKLRNELSVDSSKIKEPAKVKK